MIKSGLGRGWVEEAHDIRFEYPYPLAIKCTAGQLGVLVDLLVEASACKLQALGPNPLGGWIQRRRLLAALTQGYNCENLGRPSG